MLRTLPDESVHCCVTSPPYYGLRNYGVDGQIGLEPTLKEYLGHLTAVFEEVRRVLKKNGTCWVNMGDSYFTGAGAARLPGGGTQGKEFHGPNTQPNRLPGCCDLKPKNLMGVPWRLAFALQDAGWYLRSDIVWHKPNPMPESCKDRPTRAHEYIFLLTKSSRYWYDADAIRTVESAETKKLSYETMDYKRRDSYREPTGWDTGKGSHGTIHKNGRSDKQRGHSRRHQGFNERWDFMTLAEQKANGANARTVWTVASTAYKWLMCNHCKTIYETTKRLMWRDAEYGKEFLCYCCRNWFHVSSHFATFPPEIPKRCILAGCPCGGTVLDPFGGSGTTGAVAKELGRDFILIELNSEYVALAEKRINAVTGSLFMEVSA